MNTIASATLLVEIAALIGDVARANILIALTDGRAMTASELAFQASVRASTASEHLAKLLDAKMISVEKQGRHRYFRLARPEVAAVIETLMTLSVEGPTRYRPTGPKDEALRAARTCYDHLAGRLGVGIADALVKHGRVTVAEGVAVVSDEGLRFLCDFGIDLTQSSASKRPLCRACLDWSERRLHLAGRLGAAILTRTLTLKWIARSSDSRAIRVTELGRKGFRSEFDLDVS